MTWFSDVREPSSPLRRMIHPLWPILAKAHRSLYTGLMCMTHDTKTPRNSCQLLPGPLKLDNDEVEVCNLQLQR